MHYKIVIFLFFDVMWVIWGKNQTVEENGLMGKIIQNRAPKPSEYSPCYWQGITSNLCNVNCFSIDPIYIGGALEYFQYEYPECEQLGFMLNASTPNFNNYIMPANWFIGNVNIYVMDIQLNINEIKPNAFVADAFRTITYLKLRSLGVKNLETGIFNGLLSLKNLIMEFNGVININSNLLEPVKNTLQYLKVTQATRTTTHSINGLTGNAILSALTVVDFNYNNFMNTIGRTTFNGLIAVKEIDLSQAEIVYLGNNAFDPMANTIQTINLQSNKIKILPEFLFNYIFGVNTNVKFYFENNQFECNCSLADLKYFLIHFPQHFPDKVLCKNPMHFRDGKISTTDFCLDDLPPPSIYTTESAIGSTSTFKTTYPPTSTQSSTIISTLSEITLTTTPLASSTITSTSSTTGSTSPTTGSSTYTTTSTSSTINTNSTNTEEYLTPSTEPENDSTKEQTNSNTMPITSTSLPIDFQCSDISLLREQQIPISIMTDPKHIGNVILQTENDLNNYILLYFNDSKFNNSIIKCLKDISKSITIPNLQINTGYTFCLMNPNGTTVSPLNCVSHFVSDTSTIITIWITESSKTLLISMFVLLLSICLILSILLGIYLEKNFIICCSPNESNAHVINQESENVRKSNNRQLSNRNSLNELPPPYEQYANDNNTNNRSRIMTNNDNDGIYEDGMNFSQCELLKRKFIEKQLNVNINAENIYGLDKLPEAAAPKQPAPSTKCVLPAQVDQLLPDIEEIPLYLSTTEIKCSSDDDPIYAALKTAIKDKNE